MQTQNKGGDVLASGAVRAQFPPASGVSQEKWDSIFADFDPETYKNSTPEPSNREKETVKTTS